MRSLSRQTIERREHELLAPEAAFSDESRGRARPEEEDELRPCFQRDRDRILHSKSFRRLANKTQVFLAPEGDHYRTRLTHTLEVSQIARSISRSLGLNEDLTDAIALGHDLGHTPFGHCGEEALAKAMARYRGIDPNSRAAGELFRHNEQGVRIVELLEKGGRGLNLTREVVDGIRCHRGRRRAMTLEGRVVAVSDRIAYVNHDIDDAQRAGLLTEDMLPSGPCAVLGTSVSRRITTLVQDVVRTSAATGDIVMSPEVCDAMMDLREFLFAHLYKHGEAKEQEPKAQALLSELFAHYVTHVDELPQEYRLHDEDHPERQVADFISSMTDRYAIRVYSELRVPHAWGLR